MTENEIRQIAKEIDPHVYISFERLYQQNNVYRIIAIKKSTYSSFIVPDLNAPEITDKLKKSIEYIHENC